METIKEVSEAESLLKSLCSMPKETEWLEFKHNNIDPDLIGKYISAIANSTALCGRQQGYLIIGVDDDKHELIGTKYNIEDLKRGNEDFEGWVSRMLQPHLHFELSEFDVRERHLIMFVIYSVRTQPVAFKSVEYIRVGSYTKKLSEYPEKARRLWMMLEDENRASKWEKMPARGATIDHLDHREIIRTINEGVSE